MSTIKLVGGPYDGGRLMFSGNAPALVLLPHGPRIAAYSLSMSDDAPAGMEPRRFDGYLERQEAK